MILGIPSSLYTAIHVLLSMVGIASGLIAVFGLTLGMRLHRWTALFLASTLATVITGFGFPFDRLLPSHVIGIISLAALAAAIVAYYFRPEGRKRDRLFASCAAIALYLNVFIAVVQVFEKVHALKVLAPTQSELPFVATQLTIFAAFLALGTLATVKSGVKA